MPPVAVELSFCIVNTEQRELLLRGLDAVAAEQARAGFETEVLVLDNASGDGSADAARARTRPTTELIALERPARQGRERLGAAPARPRALRAAAQRGLRAARRAPPPRCATRSTAEPRAGAAGARAAAPGRAPAAVRVALPGAAHRARPAAFLHRRLVVQSRGDAVRDVDWAQSAALLVRREAAARIGWLDPAFFVYSDEVDFCKRLHDAGWRVLYVPGRGRSTTSSSPPGRCRARRIVELARNRDRYMRKHHSAPAAAAVRVADARGPTRRARPPRSCCPATTRAATRRTSSAALRPGRGEGLREAAAALNRDRRRAAARR